LSSDRFLEERSWMMMMMMHGREVKEDDDDAWERGHG
jgi:hypothetical protein